MQSFIAKPSLDKKLQRAGRICPPAPPPPSSHAPPKP